MIDYCLFRELVEGSKEEFIKGLLKHYNEEVKHFIEEKEKWITYNKRLEELEPKALTDKMYCMNPEETNEFKKVHSRLKTDIEGLKAYAEFAQLEGLEKLSYQRLGYIQDDICKTIDILKHFGIEKDFSKIKFYYKEIE